MENNKGTICVQGGAGTSVNMNANEVIANRALEIMGHEKADYLCKHAMPESGASHGMFLSQ
jgi:aspartate ammonia-lyase